MKLEEKLKKAQADLKQAVDAREHWKGKVIRLDERVITYDELIKEEKQEKNDK